MTDTGPPEPVDRSVVEPAGSGRSNRLVRARRGSAGILATLGVALLAFDDVQPLRAVGGGAFASPGWIPLVLAAALLVRDSDLRRRRLLWGASLAIAAYAVLLTTVTVIIDPSPAYGEGWLEKAAPALGSFLIWLTMLCGGYVLATTARRRLLIGVGIMFGLMAVGALLYRFGIHVLDDLPLIHSGVNEQQRVRSTRFEASSLGGGMLASTALAVALIKRRSLRFWVALVGLVATVALTDSRGTELIAAAGLVLLVVVTPIYARWRRSGARTVVSLAGVVVIGSIIGSICLGLIVQSQLWHAAGLSDGASGTSDATRAGWAFIAGTVLISSPLGLGFGAYLHETPALLHQAISALSSSYGPGALAELANAARGVSDTGVSPKTAPTLAAFHLGWVGLVALAVIWFVVLVRSFGLRSDGRGSVPGLVTAATVILVASAYYSSLTAWEQALLYGVVLGVAASTRRRGVVPTSASSGQPARREAARRRDPA